MAAMRYGSFPTAHRSAAKAFAYPAPEWGPGFQRPPSGVPGVPANDNWPFAPPANDNFPQRPPPSASPPYKPWVPPGKLAGLAGKALPLVGWIVFGKEVYDLAKAIGQGGQAPIPAGWNMMNSGWSSGVSCNAFTPERVVKFQTQPTHFMSCLTAQFITSGMVTFNYKATNPVAANVRYLYYMDEYVPFSVTRARTVVTWGRPAVNNADFLPRWDDAVAAQPARWVEPEVWPPYVPQLDPLTMSPPVGVPAPRPMPVPYPAIPGVRPNPARSPREQPHRGPRPGEVEPMPYGRPKPRPVASPIPPSPVTEITARPGRKPKVQHKKKPHRPKPPKKGDKEQKFNAAKGGVPAQIFSAVTEGMDVIRPIWEALPAEAQTWPPNPYSMVKDIYYGWDQIVWHKAISGIVQNQAEDMFWGKVGQTVSKGSGKLGKGIQHGPAL